MRWARGLLLTALAGIGLMAAPGVAAPAGMGELALEGRPFAMSGTVGFELDALPFLTGGYYGSVWFGAAPWRLRAVVSGVNVPALATQPQYEHLRLDVVALIADWFFGTRAGSLAGPWVGGGLERWDNRIEPKGAPGSATFSNDVVTVGGGYVLTLRGNWYLNPWFAAHYLVGGDFDVDVGRRTYHPPRASGEVSLKLGWHF
jgi:hypothetical protein